MMRRFERDLAYQAQVEARLLALEARANAEANGEAPPEEPKIRLVQ